MKKTILNSWSILFHFISFVICDRFRTFNPFSCNPIKVSFIASKFHSLSPFSGMWINIMEPGFTFLSMYLAIHFGSGIKVSCANTSGSTWIMLWVFKTLCMLLLNFPNGALYQNYVPNRPRSNWSRDPNTNFWIEHPWHSVSELGPSQGHYV